MTSLFFDILACAEWLKDRFKIKLENVSSVRSGSEREAQP